MSKKINIHQEYINYHEDYLKKFGLKTIVLMQVGSFYEMYMTNEQGPNLKDISQMLNIVYTKRDKSIREVDIKNPYMLGFPLISADKFITILINNGFTIVTIDQVTPPPDPDRKCTNIFSPATYISSTPTVNTNYAVLLYFSYEKQLKKKNIQNIQNLLCVGLSAVDVSTGKVFVDESLSTPIDTEIALDDTIRFLSNTSPREIFIVFNNTHQGKMNINSIIEYLQIDMKITKIKSFDDKYNKINYQEEYLKNIYTNTNNLVSQIEALDLEYKNYGRTSLIMLIDYISDYNKNIIKNLSTPEFVITNNNLILGNNAVYQLSVIEHDESTYMMGTKFKSLLDVVNNAITAMGKRYTRISLLNPSSCPSIINSRLDNISKLLEKDNYKDFCEKLSLISDIEKLKRKINLNIIQPIEMADFIESFTVIQNILGDIYNLRLNNIITNKNIIKEVETFNNYMSSIFNKDILRQNLLRDIKTNFFNPNVDKKLDEINNKFNREYDVIVKLQNSFNKVINQMNKIKKINKKTKKIIKKSNKKQINKDDIIDNNSDTKEDNNLITIQNTSSEGYFLQISSLRYKNIVTFLENLKKQPSSEDEVDSDEEENNDVFKTDLNLENLDIKQLKSVTKIFPKIKKEDNMTDIIDELSKRVEEIYYIKLKFIYDKYSNLFDKIISIITQFDYVLSNTITAKNYGYTKPKIVTNSHSYFNAKDLRHPIVERLIDYEYIPHSINLGKEELQGMLIYGLNSSGKSVLMKAVGLSVIMAQAGMYVPASYFELAPYQSIYTRITGNDNLFKGLSSFTLEMVELNSIIKRSQENSLVIGDEVCRGTEHISGNALVASTIVSLSRVKASFIFATHLHELVNLECIKILSNVKAYHLSVEFDPKSDTLIYDRKLKEGSGDKVYGILVAKYIIQNKDFIDLTNQIKNELMNTDSSMIPDKKSRYNSNVYVYKCQMCNKNDVMGDKLPLQTHHINFQKNCKDDKVIGKEYILKNSQANLVVLCEDCHEKIHDGEKEIKGYVMTSKGKKLK
jgi:DNA mismatch repair protein MutS